MGGRRTGFLPSRIFRFFFLCLFISRRTVALIVPLVFWGSRALRPIYLYVFLKVCSTLGPLTQCARSYMVSKVNQSID